MWTLLAHHLKLQENMLKVQLNSHANKVQLILDALLIVILAVEILDALHPPTVLIQQQQIVLTQQQKQFKQRDLFVILVQQIQGALQIVL